MRNVFQKIAVAFGTLAMPGGLAAAPAKPDGAVLFKQRCQLCHQAVAGKPSPLGPNLAGVEGRKAGIAKFAYSPALKASAVVWTRPNLDRFLTAPTKMVPGTRMVIAVSDPAQRAAIVEFLSKAK